MSTFSLDTNVLIYAIDPSQGAKHAAAQALLEQALNGAWPIALQVLGEFYSATTRKKVLTHAEAARTVTDGSCAIADSIASLAAGSEARRTFWRSIVSISVVAFVSIKTVPPSARPANARVLIA